MDENKAIILIVATVALVAVIVMISGSGQQAAGNEVTGNVALNKIFKSKSYTSSSMAGMAYRSQAKKNSPFNPLAQRTGSETNSLQRLSVFRNIAGKSIIQTEITDNKFNLFDVIQVDTAAKTQRGVIASIGGTEAEFINTVNPDGTKNSFIVLRFIKNEVRYTYVAYVSG